MHKSQIYLIVVLLVVGSGIVLSATFFSGIQQTTTASTETLTTTTTQTSSSIRSQIASDINSTLICTPSLNLQNKPGFSNLTTNIETYPTFVNLEQNRSGYQYGGGGCYNGDNGTQISLGFEYTDFAHPFPVCGNSTSWPTYYIDLNLFLTQEGYDLSKTTWSTRYYNAQNTTVSCTKVTST